MCKILASKAVSPLISFKPAFSACFGGSPIGGFDVMPNATFTTSMTISDTSLSLALIQAVALKASGTGQSSRRIGIMRDCFDTLATIAASSSSFTHFFSMLFFDRITMKILAFAIPTSNILSTMLSPGLISHLSSHASIPFARSPWANGTTNLSLSSDA